MNSAGNVCLLSGEFRRGSLPDSNQQLLSAPWHEWHTVKTSGVPLEGIHRPPLDARGVLYVPPACGGVLKPPIGEGGFGGGAKILEFHRTIRAFPLKVRFISREEMLA